MGEPDGWGATAARKLFSRISRTPRSVAVPGVIAFRGVIGNAAHGDGLAFFAVAGGQRDLEFTRSDHGIFVKQLVKIAQSE